MRNPIRIYVFAVLAAAIVWTSALYAQGPQLSSAIWSDALLISALAFAAETFTVLLPRSATGSMGFILYFALALVAPNWTSVVTVAAVRAILELWARREPIKATFNVAVFAFTEALAVTVYAAAGGVSLLHLANVANVVQTTRAVGAPALLMCVVALTANNLLVNTAIALSMRRSVLRVWSENHRTTIAVDLLATPLVFVFAWVYAAFGVIMTATLWIPILGLRQLQRTNLELEKTNQELLELMVKSLEARDAYTSGHSRRVQHYSTIIARAFGLADKQVEQVSKAALLHDVGKIHEKYAAVLAKTEKLTQEEWALIQDHPDDGADLVATMSHLKDIVPAVRHHHENWDGTGYPQGLAGELIPLSSRIIRFADTIDAMTTERPYRAPLTEAQVRAEIVRCRGTQFDPMITDKLLSSPLWMTLFAPATLQPAAPSLKVIGQGYRRTASSAKASREA